MEPVTETPDASVKVPEGYQVLDLGQGRHQVRMSGLLHAGWAGRLAAALAERRVNVVRGRGARRAGHLWEAELIVEPLERGTDLGSFDFLALARDGRPPGETANLVLDAFSLTRTAEELVVDVEAVDGLGFLDRILRVFAVYNLFPRELHIETKGRTVRDQFHLQSLNGQSPSLQVCEAVGLKLRDLAGPTAQ
jgi:hypothetical protein